MDLSASSAPAPRPRFWEKRVLAAYLRMCGHSQKEVAAEICRTDRTIRFWEAETFTWQAAREEASRRWLNDLVDAARGTVIAAVRAGDAEIGLKVLERTIPALAPPKTRVEVTIPWDLLSDEQLRRLAAGEDPAKVLANGSHNGQYPG